MPLYTRRFLLVTAFVTSAFASVCPAQQQTPEEVLRYINSLPPGTPIEIEHSTTTQKAAGQGASAQATGDKLDQKIDSDAPAVTLPGVTSTGGSTSASTLAAIYSNFWLRLIVGLLGAAIAGLGVWGIYRGQPLKSTTGLIGTGLALGASAIFIDFALILLSAIGLYNAGSLFLTGEHVVKTAETALRFKEALRAVAVGVSKKGTPDLLAEISSHASDEDKATIKEIKREDDL